jgi:threonine synthase
VPKALGDFLNLEAIHSTNGCALAVTDAELLAAQREIAGSEGMLVCPEGVAAVAANRILHERGEIGEGEVVVALNTGAGIRYPETLEAAAPLLDPDGHIPVPQVGRPGASRWCRASRPTHKRLIRRFICHYLTFPPTRCVCGSPRSAACLARRPIMALTCPKSSFLYRISPN